ncbi:Pericentriolar material 1 protein [Amphibalanus amphitrite]|uniref:Pericentriolar material 1 protein n=1 Tax=Amphibalanus amphitrite TaxID=1232801 RepID=A0A6A4V205_AMPAM|nr:Pericentriolar material 1 protein [Amphibalanus amphitrite]
MFDDRWEVLLVLHSSLAMAEDWLTSAVNGLSLEQEMSGGARSDSPSLSSNISQLLKSTRRDRADLEARLTQLRGFIQQTDEVMRGILESGDPALAAKYSHLAGTRRSLEQNAAHLQELLLKVTESEARARQLAERGRQLEAEEAGSETEALAGAAGAGPTANDRPDHEQKVAVVRGRPGPGAARKRDGGDPAGDSLRAAVLHNWGNMERSGAGRPRTFSAQEEPAEDRDADGPAAVPMDRLLRALRGEPARSAAPPAGPLHGAEAALRDKAMELDATRQKLQQLRQLMAAVQDARLSGATTAEAPPDLRALLGEVEAALDGADGLEEEPERGDTRGCDDYNGGRSSGPHSLPPTGVMRPMGRVARGTPTRDPVVMSAGLRRSAGREVPQPPRPASADRVARAASLEPSFLMSRQVPAERPPSPDGDMRAQLQHVTAMVQSLSRQPWSQHHAWPGMYHAGHPTPPPPVVPVDEPPTMELADGFGPQSRSMLNNQVAPGSRANNYWDNFRSYSRQNLLSAGTEGERESERPRGDSESQEEPRAEGFMARPRAKKQKVNKENQQLDRGASNTRAAAVPDPSRPRVHRASTPQNNPQVDAIYSCVTALIAQNQEEPEFLINLLHDLQLVRTECQRRQVQLAVQAIVVEELSGARHKQRNRAASASAAVSAPQASAGHHLLAAEREEIKSHLVNKHTKNLSHSLRPEAAEAGGHSDIEDTTTKNLAPHKNAANKNTAKPKTFEPPSMGPMGLGPLPLDDSELQLARLLHEMNVFLNDHQSALLSAPLLARLERLLLRALCQGHAAPPPGLNQQLEQAMVPFMGHPVAESGGRLVQAVLERLGALLRARELPPSPPAAELPPPAGLAPHGLDSESEDEQRPTDLADKRHERQGTEPNAPALQHLPADDGPQTIPEQEVPTLNGREAPQERPTGEPADPSAPYRQLGTPRDTPEPPGTHESANVAEPDT